MGTERPIAVVSGAASGIGRATALLLARRGYDVAAADLDLDGAERTAESADHVHAFAVDVAEPSSVHELAGAVRRRLGVPWAVVNCAGWDDIKPFIDTEPGLWRRVLDINLLGVVAMSHTSPTRSPTSPPRPPASSPDRSCRSTAG